MSVSTTGFARTAGLKLLAHAYGWRRFQSVTDHEYLPLDKLQDRQLSRLRNLLVHAYDNVPYYADRFEQAGITPDDIRSTDDLRKLPALTKQDVAANFPDRLIAGGRRGLSWKHLTSTGTTSDRIDVVLNVGATRWRHALQLRSDMLSGCPLGVKRIEIPPDVCSQECGTGQTHSRSFWQEVRYASAQSGKPLYEFASVLGQVIRRSIRETLFRDTVLPPFGPEGTCIAPQRLDEYVEKMRQLRPHFLVALPTYLQEISRHLVRENLQVPIKLIRPIGSVSTEAMKRQWAGAFAATVRETYGSNELGPIACECSYSNGLHVAMENYVVEFVRNGEPVRPGELGEIIVTCLDNYAMPMLRYRIGDVGKWHDLNCGCGRNSKLIEVNGRLQDTIVLHNGRAIPEDSLMDFFYYEVGVRQFQLIERKPGAFDLLVVPEDGTALQPAQAADQATRLLGTDVDIDPFIVDTIYPEPTGKFRFVKSKSYSRF